MAGTSYFTVYKRAITEFKDPTLKNLLENDTVMFSQVMYNFLENAISLFTNPIPAQKRVNDRVPPKFYSQTFIGDGSNKQFTLTDAPDASLIDDCLFEYTVDGNKVKGVYTDVAGGEVGKAIVGKSHTKGIPTVMLDPAPFDGAEVIVNIYYVGNWNVNLYPMEEYILSEFIMAAWSEYIQNDKLDIVRLLGDTDFKLTSVSSATTSKSSWYIVNRETVTKRMTKYAWDAAIQRLYP